MVAPQRDSHILQVQLGLALNLKNTVSAQQGCPAGSQVNIRIKQQLSELRSECRCCWAWFWT